jgi:predicted RNA binding protein YcfA (HicA-like mRNA interferase family)
MPKLPVLRPRQVNAALEKANFRQVRQRGSHIQFKRGNQLVTVPNHPAASTNDSGRIHCLA